MNEIVLRTNAGEYTAGDTLYGAVYLKIHSPTIGCGVTLKFFGHEKLYNGIASNSSNSDALSKTYINSDDIIVHKQKGPLEYGCYIFPFKFKLPDDIPGSFNWKHADKLCEACITYELHAEVIQATSIHTMKTISVLDSTPHTVSLSSTQHLHRRYLGLLKSSVTITASVDDGELRCGRVCHVKLRLTNGAGVAVQCIRVQLKQCLVLAWPGKRSNDDVINNRRLSQNSISEDIIREINLKSDGRANLLELGAYDILLVLSRPDGDIPPSTNGSLVHCTYRVQVVVTFQNGEEVWLTVPLHRLLPPHNFHWKRWIPPAWVSSASVIQPLDPLSVPHHILYGEAFLTVPPFHPLNN